MMVSRSLSETTAMNRSDLFGPGVDAAGFAFYSYGTSIIIDNPWTTIRWSLNEGPITEEGGAAKELQKFFVASEIEFNKHVFPMAPGSVTDGKGTIQVNRQNHEAALQAEIERTAGDEAVVGEFHTTNVSPGMLNEKGTPRYLDIRYQTRTFLYGAANNYVEVKTGLVKFNGKKGGTPAVQARADAPNLKRLNAEVAGIRGIGQAMRVGGASLGVAGAAYDIYSTGSTVSEQLTAGNVSGAVLSTAEFGGRWTGLALGTGIGSILGGPIGGFVGGMIGAYGLEKGVRPSLCWTERRPFGWRRLRHSVVSV